MDYLASHPEIGPELLTLVYASLAKAETRVRELEAELDEERKACKTMRCTMEGTQSLLDQAASDIEAKEKDITVIRRGYAACLQEMEHRKIQYQEGRKATYEERDVLAAKLNILDADQRELLDKNRDLKAELERQRIEYQDERRAFSTEREYLSRQLKVSEATKRDLLCRNAALKAESKIPRGQYQDDRKELEILASKLNASDAAKQELLRMDAEQVQSIFALKTMLEETTVELNNTRRKLRLLVAGAVAAAPLSVTEFSPGSRREVDDSPMCETVAPTSDEVEEDANVDNPPRAKSVQDERRLYLEYVGGLRQPTGLPPITELKPIYSAAGSQLECGAYLHKSIGIKKPFLFVPNRVMWCPDSPHALLFCPTHLYDRLWGDWWERLPEAAPAGQSKELFVNAEDSTAIIYAGTYVVRSLRHVHSPGSPLPGHLSGRQINLAAGIGDKPNAYYPIEDRFPDGKISTECFGLQRVGFDAELYATLLARYKVPDVTVGEPAKKKRKRKKGAETVALQEGAPVL